MDSGGWKLITGVQGPRVTEIIFTFSAALPKQCLIFLSQSHFCQTTVSCPPSSWHFWRRSICTLLQRLHSAFPLRGTVCIQRVSPISVNSAASPGTNNWHQHGIKWSLFENCHNLNPSPHISFWSSIMLKEILPLSSIQWQWQFCKIYLEVVVLVAMIMLRQETKDDPEIEIRLTSLIKRSIIRQGLQLLQIQQ